MASFAKIGAANIVEKVVVVSNVVITDNDGNEQEQLGVDFLNNLYGTTDVWKQTSYNTRAGTHTLGGTPLRKNHASSGFTYDEGRDAFIPPKPFASWVLNEDTCQWEEPIPRPSDGNYYDWDEEIQNWKQITHTTIAE
jgi:hypothetical protein